MTDYRKVKLLQIIDECNRHINRMLSAHKKMSHFMPLEAGTYNSLNDGDIEHIDQFIFRFSKLQDAMGEKLFGTFLSIVDENVKTKTFIDILNRLEALALLEANEWKSLRELRNQVAHEYSTRIDEIVSSINTIYDRIGILYNIFVRIKNFALEKILAPDDIDGQYILKSTEF